MKNYKKLLSGLMIAAMVSGAVIPASASAKKDIIQGKDIYQTAGKIADRQKYKSVVLVNLENGIADGLSASGLAGATKSVILPIKRGSIPDETLKRLKGVRRAYIVGEENVVSEYVENRIENMGIDTERVGGRNRFETSYEVAEEISDIKRINTIAITNGYKGEADSISIASAAVRDGMPVILTDGNKMPFSTKGKKVYAIGGKSVISDALVKKTNAERLGGKDRYETNRKIINRLYKGAKRFYAVDGNDLKNALIGSTIAKNEPIVLVSKKSDKSIFKNAEKVGKIGILSNSIYEDCLR